MLLLLFVNFQINIFHFPLNVILLLGNFSEPPLLRENRKRLHLFIEQLPKSCWHYQAHPSEAKFLGQKTKSSARSSQSLSKVLFQNIEQRAKLKKLTKDSFTLTSKCSLSIKDIFCWHCLIRLLFLMVDFRCILTVLCKGSTVINRIASSSFWPLFLHKTNKNK